MNRPAIPRRSAPALLGATLLAAGMVAPSMAQADDYSWMLAVLNNNRIQDGVGAGASGNIAINTAAGSGNIQSNQRQINVPTAGFAMPQSGVAAPRNMPQSMTAQTEIAGQAFSHASGVLGINQVSGAGNAQVNTMSMGGGQRQLLEGIRASGPIVTVRNANTSDPKSGQASGSSSDRYKANISNDAFAGFGGVLQINQVSGSGNVTANHFSISSP